MKRYEARFMITSIELDAKNKTEARIKATKLLKEDLKKKWVWEIDEVSGESKGKEVKA